MEIFGFKSFADRSRIEFTSGITALLGPNGCGKSNVVDAIKWVLGEQASKSLRAEKMEDVIFNGTDSRKALNVAEVTLTISNEGEVLSLDLPEISIKRRLYRSGESEYFINNVVVRLKEVRELFYDTGVGKSAYSVMEQGRIDQILSHKPEERRYLFEEAAGITKYKARGQEAERRLERTEENLRQLEGILGEIRHSWESLRKQSDKTLVYRDLKKELFELEKEQQLGRWKGLIDQQSHQQRRLEAAELSRDQASRDLGDLNQVLAITTKEVNELEAELFEIQKKLLTLDLERKGLLQQRSLQNERLAQYAEDAARQDVQLNSVLMRKKDLEQEAASWGAELDRLKTELEVCQKNLVNYTKALETCRVAVTDHEIGIERAEICSFDLEQQDLTFQEQWRQLTDNLVQELDQRLREEGFAWHRLPGLTNSMEITLAALKTLLAGRIDLLNTLLASPGSTVESLLPVVRQVVTTLGEGQRLLQEFEENWDTYRGAIPQFLGEFLAPEGIITQKRDLEHKMAKGRADLKVQREEIRHRQQLKDEANQLIEVHRATLEDLRVNEVRMLTRQAAALEGAQRVSQELASQEVLRSHTEAERSATVGKRESCLLDLEKLVINQLGFEEQEHAAQALGKHLESELSMKTKALAARKNELQAYVDRVNHLQSEVEGFRVTLVRIDTEIDALLDHFRDKHSVELQEFAPALEGTSELRQDLRELVAQKKEELRLLGQINLMAVEEFAEVDDRHKFLGGQINDLRKAREDLHRVTAEIRKESTQLFSVAFEQIQINFDTTFQRLFGGGRAELRLTEPETVLESGIEMLCQPPGKRLENINLLSGGEKSMTAVALLFATFMVRPSPFCILDEIDAALDEANVSRFVDMLTEFSDRSQFVVITHNKKTVTGSSTMIGVTMEQPGISKVLAVRLSTGQEAIA